jgi:hypothetical protein
VLPHHRKRQRSSLASTGMAARAAHDGDLPQRLPRPAIDLERVASDGIQLLSSAAELDSEAAAKIECQALQTQRSASLKEIPTANGIEQVMQAFSVSHATVQHQKHVVLPLLPRM